MINISKNNKSNLSCFKKILRMMSFFPFSFSFSFLFFFLVYLFYLFCFCFVVLCSNLLVCLFTYKREKEREDRAQKESKNSFILKKDVFKRIFWIFSMDFFPSFLSYIVIFQCVFFFIFFYYQRKVTMFCKLLKGFL